jgi:CubicO group peptidase (beta-lactamase class C family)
MLHAFALILTMTANAHSDKPAFPGTHWETCTTEQAGLDVSKLDAIRDFMGGRGCIVRHGKIAYFWGDIEKREDVASAFKPLMSLFLFKAVEDGRLRSIDEHVMQYVPGLSDLNAELGYKDRAITFRHMATQTSCYGVTEKPGEAFNYNDWQMALLFDTLTSRVYRCPIEKIDASLLHPLLTDILQCEDNPTLLPYGLGDRPGRLAISPRDFCRIGLLFLKRGKWNGKAILSEKHATELIASPLPLSILMSRGEEAQMLNGQRSIGNRDIPCNLADHEGSYSWLWWINGTGRDGSRLWPNAPLDIFAALGHENGMRGLAVIPSLDIIISWNDTRIGGMPEKPEPLDTTFALLSNAVNR